MTKSESNRGPVLGVAFVVLTFLLAAATAPLFADPPKKADVEFKIKKPGGVYELLVGPRGVGICKNPSKCDDFITFDWKGWTHHGYDKITVTFTGPNKACLKDPTVVLTSSAAQSTELDPDACAALCPDQKKMTAQEGGDYLTDGCKLAVFYEVKAEDTDGPNPDLIVDPGVIIDQ